MAWFRRSKTAPESEQTPSAPTVEPSSVAPESEAVTPDVDGGRGSSRGPWDVSEVSGADGYLRLGAVWIPALEGLMFTFEMDQSQSQVTAVQVVRGDSTLQIQAFAAPRSSGLWEEIRGEIAEGIQGRGGRADEEQGDLGTELVVDVQGTVMRFVGVDGPRWFLRGVLSGRAATDPEAAAPLREVFDGVVVDRGSEPMGPRELLPLTLPTEVAESGGAPEEGRSASDLDPFTRGPEITEIR